MLSFQNFIGFKSQSCLLLPAKRSQRFGDEEGHLSLGELTILGFGNIQNLE